MTTPNSEETEDGFLAGERSECGQPCVDTWTEHEGHETEVGNVDGHVDQREGEVDAVVTAGLLALGGGLGVDSVGVRFSGGEGFGHGIVGGFVSDLWNELVGMAVYLDIVITRGGDAPAR